MQPLELTNIFTSRLEAVGLTYFVTGSVASLVYGEPRMTHDVDLVLTLADADARASASRRPGPSSRALRAERSGSRAVVDTVRRAA